VSKLKELEKRLRASLRADLADSPGRPGKKTV